MNRLSPQLITYILLVLALGASATGCVMVFTIADEVERTKHEIELLVKRTSGGLAQPEEVPEITDSTAFYNYREDVISSSSFGPKRKVKVHRFFFKRASYTDSLFGGFSVVVANVSGKGVILERQRNVTVTTDNLGKKVGDWRRRVNLLTRDNEPYFALSNDAMKLRTLVRTSTF